MGIIRKKRRKREMLEFSLNITSLMDVLTVLLFFLMKSFSVSASVLNPPEGVRLPSSTFKGAVEETVTLAMSEKEIRANDQVIVQIKGGRFLPDQLGRDQRTITALKAFLDEQFKKRNEIYKGQIEPASLPPGKVLIQADRSLTFASLKYLFHTAAAAGYTDYQFVVNTIDD